MTTPTQTEQNPMSEAMRSVTLTRSLERVRSAIPALNEFHGYAHGVALTDIRIIVEALDALTADRDAAEAQLRESREALARLVSEYDDDGEHGLHAYEQECPLCCAIEDARALNCKAHP